MLQNPVSPHSPVRKPRRNNQDADFSTPERKQKSEEKMQEMIKNTPKPKRTSKRKSLINELQKQQQQLNNNKKTNINNYQSQQIDDVEFTPVKKNFGNFDNNNNGDENDNNIQNDDDDDYENLLEPIQEINSQSFNFFEDEQNDSNSYKNKPFFQKLNDSCYKPQKCYQLLFVNNNNTDQVNEHLNIQQQQNQELQENQIPRDFSNIHSKLKNLKSFNDNNNQQQSQNYNVLVQFLKAFNQKSNKIMSLFSENASIEVIGEEQQHSLNQTLLAFAQNINTFQFQEDDLQTQDFQGLPVYSMQGEMQGSIGNGEFVMSAKIAQNQQQQNQIECLKVIFKFSN